MQLTCGPGEVVVNPALARGSHIGQVRLQAPQEDLGVERVVVTAGRAAQSVLEVKVGEVVAAVRVVEHDVEGGADREEPTQKFEVSQHVGIVGHGDLLVEADIQST